MKTPEERAQEVRREMMDAATGDRTNTEWNQLMCHLIAREIHEAVVDAERTHEQQLAILRDELLRVFDDHLEV